MELGFDDIPLEGFSKTEHYKPLNDAGIETDNQVPPEYANDPELWYTIQASLKVSHFLKFDRIC